MICIVLKINQTLDESLSNDTRRAEFSSVLLLQRFLDPVQNLKPLNSMFMLVAMEWNKFVLMFLSTKMCMFQLARVCDDGSLGNERPPCVQLRLNPACRNIVISFRKLEYLIQSNIDHTYS